MRTLCKISIAIIVTSIVAAFLLPAVYSARGYMDIGGEWLLLFAVFVMTYNHSM